MSIEFTFIEKLGLAAGKRSSGRPYEVENKGHRYSDIIDGPRAELRAQANELCSATPIGVPPALDTLLTALRDNRPFPNDFRLLTKGDVDYRRCLDCGEPWELVFDGQTFRATKSCAFVNEMQEFELVLPTGRLVVLGDQAHRRLQHGFDIDIVLSSYAAKRLFAAELAKKFGVVPLFAGNAVPTLFVDESSRSARLANKARGPVLRCGQVATDSSCFSLTDASKLVDLDMDVGRYDQIVALYPGVYRVRMHRYRSDWPELLVRDPAQPYIELDWVRPA